MLFQKILSYILIACITFILYTLSLIMVYSYFWQTNPEVRTWIEKNLYIPLPIEKYKDSFFSAVIKEEQKNISLYPLESPETINNCRVVSHYDRDLNWLTYQCWKKGHTWKYYFLNLDLPKNTSSVYHKEVGELLSKTLRNNSYKIKVLAKDKDNNKYVYLFRGWKNINYILAKNTHININIQIKDNMLKEIQIKKDK